MAALGSSRIWSSLKPDTSASEAAGAPGLAKSVCGYSVIKGGVTVSGSTTTAGAAKRAAGKAGTASGSASAIPEMTSSAQAALTHIRQCFDMSNTSSLTQSPRRVK